MQNVIPDNNQSGQTGGSLQSNQQNPPLSSNQNGVEGKSLGQVQGLVGQFTNPLTNKTVQPAMKSDEKIYAGLAYIPFISIAAIILKPDSAFVRLHAKQGLLLSVVFLLVMMLSAIVSLFGFVGNFLAFLLLLVLLALLFIGVYSMYLSFSGYWWKIPLLAQVADLIPVEMLAKASKENITGQFTVAKDDYDNRQETIHKEVQQNNLKTGSIVDMNNQNGAGQNDVVNK